MSREELVQRYLDGQVSRRVFIRGLVATGVTTAAALSYASVLESQPAGAAASEFYLSIEDYFFAVNPAALEFGQSALFVNHSWNGHLHSATDNSGLDLFDTGQLVRHQAALVTPPSAGTTVALKKKVGSATTLYWYVANQQGSSAFTIPEGSTGTPTRKKYKPFGQQRGTASLETEHGFVGGTEDTTTGLAQLGARYYDPALSRFLSTDPIKTPYTPQNLNPYSYSINNPTTHSDPTGLNFCSCGGGGGSSSTKKKGGGDGGGGTQSPPSQTATPTGGVTVSTDATSDEQVYLVAFDVNTCQGGLCHHSLVWSEPLDALALLDMAQQDGNERLRYIFEDLDNGEENATGTDFKDDDQIGENDLKHASDVEGIVGAVARDLLASGAWEDADFAHHSCSLGCRLSNAAEASLKVVAVATAVAASGVCIAASFGVCAGAVAAGWAIRSGFALAAHGGDAWGSIAIDAGLSYATLATAGASSAVFASGSKSAAYEVLSAGQAGYSPLQKYGVLAAVESHGLAGSLALTLRGD